LLRQKLRVGYFGKRLMCSLVSRRLNGNRRGSCRIENPEEKPSSPGEAAEGAEKENGKLKRLVAGLSLDKQILKDVAEELLGLAGGSLVLLASCV
jgi:hypothetical protein